MAKKKGKKKKKGGDDEGPKIDPMQALQMQVSNQQTLINNLNSKLARIEKDHHITLQTNDQLNDKLSEKKSFENDIKRHFITEKQLQDKKIRELKKNLEEDSEAAQFKYAKLLDDFEKAKFENEKASKALTDKVAQLTDELNQLNLFKNEKALIEKENRDLKIEREEQKKKFLVQLQNKDNLSVKLQANLKNDMLQKLHIARNKLEKMTENHLGVKTRKTMMLNEALTREINIHSKQSAELLMTNKKLENEKLHLKRELDLTAKGREELLQKMQSQQNTIKTLVSKFRKLEELFNKKKSMFDHYEVKRNEQMDAQNHIEDLKYKYNNLQKDLDDSRQEIVLLQGRLEDERSEKQKLMNLHDEGALFLMAVLNDVKKQLGPWKVKQSKTERYDTTNRQIWDPLKIVPANLDALNINEREAVLRYILSKFHIHNKKKVTDTVDDNTFPPINSM